MSRSVCAILWVCIAALMLGGCANKMQKTAANVLIDRPGVYASPNGTHAVVIERTEAGRRFYGFLQSPSDLGRGAGPSTTLGNGNDWFMCWDAQECLWVYVLEDAPASCHVYFANAKARGAMSGVIAPGEFGGWEGIPLAFLARLPEDKKTICREYLAKQAKQ